MSASTSFPDRFRSQTMGAARRAITVIAGDTRQAIRSGSRSAICLGTSSPMISDM